MIKVQEPASVRSDAAPVRPGQSSLVTNSMTGSIWTLVSRMTGLARILVLGAVLGATYLGNTYQGMNALPNLVYYQILAGSLFVSLLVPPLMRHIREGDQERADTLVRGFFGGVLALGVIAMAAIMVAAPLILHVFSLGVSDPHSAADQRRVGLVLLLLFAPQIPLYVIAGTGAAVMNAYGRFALAAGAPTIENVGIMVTLVAVAVVYGTGGTLSNVTTTEIVILGLGTTGAVALHATLEWLGARRSQPSMRPGLAWNDPEVRTVLVRIRAVLAYTGLATLQLVVTMVIANRVGGGLVAFQLALNFFYLPTAIITWPVARALVPRLAVFHQTGNAVAFREELGKALGPGLLRDRPDRGGIRGICSPDRRHRGLRSPRHGKRDRVRRRLVDRSQPGGDRRDRLHPRNLCPVRAGGCAGPGPLDARAGGDDGDPDDPGDAGAWLAGVAPDRRRLLGRLLRRGASCVAPGRQADAGRPNAVDPDAGAHRAGFHRHGRGRRAGVEADR